MMYFTVRLANIFDKTPKLPRPNFTSGGKFSPMLADEPIMPSRYLPIPPKEIGWSVPAALNKVGNEKAHEEINRMIHEHMSKLRGNKGLIKVAY